MDDQEAAWEELAGRIALRELTSDDAVVEALEPTGLLEDPQALARARGLLERFWGMVQQDPTRALGQATLAAILAAQLGAPAVLQAELCLRRATALFALGRSKQTLALLGDGLADLAAAEQVDPGEALRTRAALLGLVGKAYLAQGQVRNALVALEEALAIVRQQDLRPALGGLLSALGNARVHAGDASSAEEYYGEALRIARKHGNREGQVVCLGNLGLVHHFLGKPGRAQERYEEALELARQLGDRRSAAGLLTNLGLLMVEAGELEQATRRYDAALELARDLNDELSAVVALMHQASVARMRGALERADELLAEGARGLEEVGDPRLSAVWSEQGHVLLARGELPAARSAFLRALERARITGERRAECQALIGLGRTALRGGDAAEAQGHLGEALELALELESPQLRGEAHVVQARASLATGDLEQAEAALAAARSVVGDAKGSLLASRVDLAGAALLARTDPEGARARLGRHLQELRQRGLALLAAEAARMLGELENQ